MGFEKCRKFRTFFETFPKGRKVKKCLWHSFQFFLHFNEAPYDKVPPESCCDLFFSFQASQLFQGPIVLVGSSVGGWLALSVAKHHSHLIHGMSKFVSNDMCLVQDL